MELPHAQANIPGIPTSLKPVDSDAVVPMCALCLRELPKNAQFFQYNSTNAKPFRETLKRTVNHDFNLEQFDICTPCWMLLQLLEEFQACCSKAASWAEQQGTGLKCADEWFSEGTAHMIDTLWKTTNQRVNLIEKMCSDRDEIVSEMSIGEIKVEPPVDEDSNPLKEDDSKDSSKVEETTTKEPDPALDVFRCTRCGTCFDYKAGLNVHLRRCQATEQQSKHVHTCELCRATFSKKALLTAHMNRHKGKKPFPCRINCDESFYSPSQRYTHEGVCRKKQETCSVCGVSFPSKQSLNNHLESVHEQSMHPCENCDNKFANSDDLSRHNILRHGTFQKSSTPNVDLSPAAEIAVDEITTSKSKTEIVLVLRCERCQRDFDNQRELKKHQLCCDGTELGHLYTCKICSVSFQFRHMLKVHVKKHKGKTTFLCRKNCNKSFNRITSRSIHEMLCGAGEQTCTICSAKLADSRSLAEHIRTEHADLRFPCETCGASFKNKKDMIQHSNQHTGNRRSWSCSMCEKMFKTAYAAKEHFNYHTKEKVYKCKFCGESYLYKASYRRHMKLCASKKGAVKKQSGVQED